MMEFAKDLVSNVSCATSDFAKSVAGKSADLAKDVAGFSADLAKRVGPKRGLIGLAIAGVAIGGGIVLARYLRARAAEAEQLDGADAPVAKNRRVAKAEKRARAAYAAVH